jgi:hypothetical protein
MELARVLRELSKHPRILAVGVLIAAVAAVMSVYRVEGAGLKSRSLQYSAASTQVLVDARSSLLGSVSQPFEPLAARAQVYANFMASPAFLEVVAAQVGLQADQLYAAGPVNANEPRVEQEPTALKRNVQITGETKPYRLSYESQQNLPTIGIYAQAPTSALAQSLADAAANGLQTYVTRVETEAGIPTKAQIVIRRLGPASGAVVNGGISKTLAAIVFVGVLLLWALLVLLATRFRDTWRQSAALEAELDEEAVERELLAPRPYDTEIPLREAPAAAGGEEPAASIATRGGR